MLRAGAHAATDVTGFGLLGHAYEMARSAGVSIRIDAERVPVLEEARPYVDAAFTCGGSARNRSFADGKVRIRSGVAEYHRIVLHDVQTSGGLLIAAPASAVARLVEELRRDGDEQAAEIGEISSEGPSIVVQ
jgi:selenide,water dikinase